MELADQLRQRTRSLHAVAERTGIVHEILLGRVTRRGYALYLRALLPVYATLEAALSARGHDPGLRHICIPALFRSSAIRSDLSALAEGVGADAGPLAGESVRYRQAVQVAAAGDGARLIAHAYTRFLGDLNGGKTIARRLRQRLGLSENALHFYHFGDDDAAVSLAKRFRAAIDAAGYELADVAVVLNEAELAFQLNIALSVAAAKAAEPLAPLA
jgi:heme oxygenase